MRAYLSATFNRYSAETYQEHDPRVHMSNNLLMSEKAANQEDKPVERRKWGKRPTYPFVDSNGVLVTNNRRRSLEVRENAPEEENAAPQDEQEFNSADTAPELPPILTDTHSELQSGTAQLKHVADSLHKLMEIEFQYNRVSVTADNRRCGMGRDKSCDIVVLNRFSSRKHGRVEWRNGRFYFCDHSFNGTYIDFDDGTTTHICRDEIILADSGYLSLGKPTHVDSDFIIRFTIS